MRVIYFDICAVIVSITILMAVLFRRYTRGRNNVLLIWLLILCMVTGCLDTFDSLFGVLWNPVDNLLIQMIGNTMYFLFRNATMPIYILFIISNIGIWYKFRSKPLYIIAFLTPIALATAAVLYNPFSGIIFSFDEHGVYRRGPMMGIVYVCAAFYIFLCIFLLYKYKKFISWMVFVMLISFVPFNLIAIIIQTINISLRIEIFALALTLLMIATVIQRPEEYMDPIVNTLSHHAFMTDMNKAYQVKRPMSIILVKLVNGRALRTNLGLEIYNGILARVGDKINHLSKVINLYTDVYYLDTGVFAIVAEDDKYEKMLDLGRLVVSYLQESFKLSKMEIKLESKSCIVRCPSQFDTYGSLLGFSYKFHITTPESNSLIILSNIIDSKDFKMKSELDEIIMNGITHERFVMYYQPIYSVKEDKFVSAEALIRLYDTRYGFVSPSLFIPAAETSGAIHKIGDYVLESVCRFIGTTTCVDKGLEYVEINLSVAQCIEPKLVEKITKLIEFYDIKPSQINLEITETSVDYDPVITDKNIYGLKEKGISFSLDDYGTGYSNIKRVSMLPLDIVKLDKTFVDEMDDPQMWTVIVNTVSMLKRMNKKILVEGVESERTLRKFIDLGCDYIQGFYFSKPLCEADFIKFLGDNNSKPILKQDGR